MLWCCGNLQSCDNCPFSSRAAAFSLLGWTVPSLASSCFSLISSFFFFYYKYHLHNSLSFPWPIKRSVGFLLAAAVEKGWKFPKKLSTFLPYCSAILLIFTCLRGMKTYIQRWPWWSRSKDSLLLMQGAWVWSLAGELVEKAMAPHSSTLAWRIPWAEEPGRLQSMGSHRVGHDWSGLAVAGN